MADSFKKPASYAAGVAELEKIVAACEEAPEDIETAIPRFRRALEVARYLKEKLSTFDNEIREIKKEFSDVLEDKKHVTDPDSVETDEM